MDILTITELPPDPKLKGWPVPVGPRNDLPAWLQWCYYKRERAETDWRIVGYNCFQKRCLPHEL